MSLLVHAPTSGLGEGISSLGTALGEALGRRLERGGERRSGSILGEEIARLGENAKTADYLKAYSSAISRGARPDIINAFAQTAQKQLAGEGKKLFSEKDTTIIQKLASRFMDPNDAEAFAQLIPQLSVGGQTAAANLLFDGLQRAGFGANAKELQKTLLEGQQASQAPQMSEEEKILQPVDTFKDLTPKERVKRESELYKDNTKIFQQTAEDLRTEESFNRDYKLLENLNNSGKLPRGLFKGVNVDLKTGKLRFPAAAKPETQQYIKTINQFLRKAKDFFGARVTNFDVQAFMETLPTLANSPEGRRVILDQMRIANEIMVTYDKNLKKVYSKYGLRGIDNQEALDKAEALSKARIDDLEEQFLESTRAEEKYQKRKRLPEGHVLMLENGEYVAVPKEDVQKALDAGLKTR